MSELPLQVRRLVNRQEPIEVDGHVLYPILVREYEEFHIARPAIEFMQQRLPVALMSVPLLQAYWTVDLESIEDDKLPAGLLYRAILFLALSLRLGEGMEPTERINLFRPRIDPTDRKRLLGLVYLYDGEEWREITPMSFQRMRPILAAQNGIELMPDTANPELVQAERDLRERNAMKLDANLESMVSTVATFSGVTETTIYDEWTVLQLQNRQHAIVRLLDYLICGIGETQGTKWKGGNPVPSPFFDRTKEGSPALVSLESFAGGAARGAVTEQDTPTDE